MTTSASQSGKRKRKGPKFRKGQIVAVKHSRDGAIPDWTGKVECHINGEVLVNFPDGDSIKYSYGDLRPLTRRERGTHGR